MPNLNNIQSIGTKETGPTNTLGNFTNTEIPNASLAQAGGSKKKKNFFLMKN
jgi:hypothetical protein